jgi:hypothetical protein
VEAELGATLDHLRQAELRSLRGVERHEDGAGQVADHDRQQRPPEAEAGRDPDRAGNHSQHVRAGAEPDEELRPGLPVPFGHRHVVVAVAFDQRRRGPGGSLFLVNVHCRGLSARIHI